ncbi:hypothetical protein GCM10007927_08730 [Sulfitobacter pacificus]|uniref:Uncharacterized protein n=1 Tax=Sulfitobacter pacificus TaxID=1499314 RepID=A0ABQ5VG60_9RHOB|nr:hypothetical protein GCM10007927_08730 [Sulfitobacter pacificus]
MGAGLCSWRGDTLPSHHVEGGKPGSSAGLEEYATRVFTARETPTQTWIKLCGLKEKTQHY